MFPETLALSAVLQAGIRRDTPLAVCLVRSWIVGVLDLSSPVRISSVRSRGVLRDCG